MIYGTVVTLSCSVSGISQVATVMWKNSGGSDVTGLGADYTVNAGTYSAGDQTTTLEILAASNTQDTTYTCDIIPNGGTAQSTTVDLNVFSKYRSLVILT